MMKHSEKLLLEELLDLVKALEDTQCNFNMEERLHNISTKYAAVSCKEDLWAILDDMCIDISDTYFNLLEYLYAATKGEEVLRKQLLVLTKGVQDGTIDLFYAIFYKWQIIHRNFMMYGSNPFFVERSNLHIEMLHSMKEYLQFDLPLIPKEERNKDRILVTITQLLGIKHGPTRNAFDYCYTLQKKMHKEVFLFVAAEMPDGEQSEYEAFGIDYGYFNYNSSYDGYFTLDYLGEKINGYQCRINPENRENIRNIIMSIYAWKPYLIYNIGSENLVVDLCGSFTDEVSVPCGNGFPITEAGYRILTRNIEDRDNDIINYLKKREQKVIESIFVYKLEEPLRRYQKSDFGINEDAYVIAVVGTRLHWEINHEFIKIMQKILEIEPSIYIVFMGIFDNFEEKREETGYGDRLKYIGHQSDLRGALNIADLYLNPPRKGGGTSAAEALAEGVPVITLGNCDVAYTSGEEFICGSLEEMPELVRKYIQDKNFYISQSKKARIQADKLVNTEDVLRGILGQIE